MWYPLIEYNDGPSRHLKTRVSLRPNYNGLATKDNLAGSYPFHAMLIIVTF